MKITSIKQNIYHKTAKYIANSSKIQSVLKSVDKNPALWGSVLAFGVAVVAKPATIAVLPAKDKDSKLDKLYSISRSVATGIADLLVGLAIFVPMNKFIDIAGKKLFETKDSIFYNNKAMCSNYKSIFNRGFKIAFMPIFAWLKFIGIEPLSDKIANNSSKNNKNRIKKDFKAVI